jgi:glycosyltransferase involved in cell wall biosynthesis
MTAAGRQHPADRRPRLLVVASTFPATLGDGTPRFVLDLALQEAESFDVQVLVPMVPGAARAEQLSEHVSVERFRYFPRRWEDLAAGAMLENVKVRRSRWAQVPAFVAAETEAIARAIRRFRPDVLHVHWTIPQGLSALLADRRLPRLVTSHGADAYALSGSASDWLKRTVLRRADAVTGVNEQIAQRLIELGADPARTSVVPMGADTAAVVAGSKGVERVPGRIVAVGRLVEKKGFGVLLDAVRQLPDDLTWSLEIVGDGPLRANLQDRAMGLPVRFWGELPAREVYRRLGAASIAVVPSVPSRSGDQDGLPVTMIEAMAAGCAVVASRLPGLQEAIVPEECGLLVTSGQATELATGLDRLLRDDATVKQMGEAAAARAEAFSIRVSGQQYRQILTDLLPR